jgi:isopentenyl diphosphate isomerase/L-lactate dehydrogenase-like FMN-dependent dehydrogenase
MTIDDPAIDLERIVSLADFEPIARAAMDPGAFDYVAGGAWDELSLGEAEAAWRLRRLRPRVLVDVSRIDPSTTMAGSSTALPLAIAPMAAHALAHPEAELATARAAAAAGIPFTLRRCRARRSRTPRPRRRHELVQLHTRLPARTHWPRRASGPLAIARSS